MTQDGSIYVHKWFEPTRFLADDYIYKLAFLLPTGDCTQPHGMPAGRACTYDGTSRSKTATTLTWCMGGRPSRALGLAARGNCQRPDGSVTARGYLRVYHVCWLLPAGENVKTAEPANGASKRARAFLF